MTTVDNSEPQHTVTHRTTTHSRPDDENKQEKQQQQQQQESPIRKLQGMKFAPLNTPSHRRLQTAAVLWHTVSIPVFVSLFFVILAVPLFWVFVIPYIIYLLLNKDPSNGGATKRYSMWFRSLKVWTYFCNFFPIKLFKSADLEPTFTEVEITDGFYSIPLLTSWFGIKINRKPYMKSVRTGPKYIFGLHPHGVVSLSGFGAIGTEGAGWSKIFPGIPTCLMTLLNQFYIPIYREYLLALGVTSAARSNALKILKDDYSLAIVVGGAQESLLARPGSNDIVLAKRKGFVKLALETGNTALVPCYCFGENNVYNILEPGDNSFGKSLQYWLKKNFGFTIPFFHARGVFNYEFGLLPYRQEVTVVTGEPIMVPHEPGASKAVVDHYHGLYVEALKRLFDDYKTKFIKDGQNAELNIVE
ncbi:CYFA0S24e01816g1_1 [Cyberlindnera fabianii]|uniref:Diacylglycerol O-acyltransferase n=1 Tax=Cyberlindnera fabianii TaxID=36022 RepID=A0A061B9M6_CYBFA|nr:CYFA0S24e01816g1_1 [Cyberlindnera fabianii]